MLGAAVLISIFNQRPIGSRPAEPMPQKPVSKPIIEKFKRDARHIGGEAFPAPKINSDRITREPSVNLSSYSSGKRKSAAPVFLLHRPVVEDITTIRSGKRTVTIAGIRPLPIDQTCRLNGETRPCGRLARTALRGLVRGRTLKCKATKKDENQVTTSCTIGKIDIAEWLIKRGWTKSLSQSTPASTGQSE